MRGFWLELGTSDGGQAITEYTLFICFLAVLGLTLYIGLGDRVKTIMVSGNTTISAAARAVR